MLIAGLATCLSKTNRPNMTSSHQIVQEKNEGFLKRDVKSINANSIHSPQLYNNLSQESGDRF